MIDTPLVLAFASGMVLTLIWTLIDRYRHRQSDRELLTRLHELVGRDGESLWTVTNALEQIVHDAGEQIRPHSPRNEDERWTMQSWAAKWLELLGDRMFPPVATAAALLRTAGDPRDLGAFVENTIALQRRLHSLLLGTDAPCSWTESVAQLEQATSTLNMGRSNQGLILERQQLQERCSAVESQLRETSASLEDAQKSVEAASALRASCGLPSNADTASIAAAAEGIALLVMCARDVIGPNSASDWNLAPRLESRVNELRSQSQRCEELLATIQAEVVAARREKDECARARDDAADACSRYELVTHQLITRLELPALSASGEWNEATGLLQSDRWTIRLLLLAVRNAWTANVAAIAPELSAFARIREVPAHCRASIAALKRIDTLDATPLHAIVMDDIEALCRLYDVTSRICELHDTYAAMHELDPFEPWARSAAAAIKVFLADRNIELRRPPLLNPLSGAFADFEDKFENGLLRSLLTTGQPITEQLDRGNDRFVIDVTQTEVHISGARGRIGVVSLVSPHHWRA